MNLRAVSVTTLLVSFSIFWRLIDGSYIGDIAVNCGYHGNTTALDGRQWFGDTDSSSDVSMLQPKGHSKSSVPLQKSLPADPIPYMTARASATQFYYSFAVNPGQKFVRLHFYPSSSYRGFEKSLDKFTVKAGPFTLLRNFSASLAADAMGVNYVVKEFCLTLEENEFLNLTFTPTRSVKGKKSFYAYVNGIEIITMPTGLYFTPDGNLGALIVGQSNRYFHIDNSTALETVQRLNIGGSSISPVEDFGMFRRWNEDSNYLTGLGSKPQPVNHLVPGTYTGVYTFTAPSRIFHTSWQTDKNGRTENAYYNFTWKIPVDLGFGYLVRLHFCDFALVEREGNNGMEVIVLIDNTVADVIRFSARNGVPIYKDYMVMVKGDEVDKYDLFVALQSSHELAIELLRGLEIFKLSNLDNNLASKIEVYLNQVLVESFNLKTKHFLSAFDRKNTIVTVITVLLILLNLIVSKLRQNQEEAFHEEKDSQLDSEKQSCRKFSLAEIILATQNFSNALLIGKGGFGYVYKGFIHGGSEIIAVKRLKSNSRQGAREFWTEIETLSKIRHKHLVSLVGYCNEYREMILVYEYMPCGTLADNLYEIGKNGEDGTCLTWEQRLSICIGAARGLDYLHTGIEQEVIHRDVKDSNILLDKNLVAKISDFGLSKLGKVSESQSLLSTKVRGTPGFVDPDYFMTHKPTTKTDVYAFGVVMLVVLCGRPAIDRSIPWEPRSLLSHFQEYIRKGDVNGIVDSSMQGKISKQSLNEFIKSLESCLHIEPRERPTMSQLATSLECALEMQQTTIAFNSEEGSAATSGQYSDGEIPSLSPIREEFTSSTGEVINDVPPQASPPPQRGEIKRALFKKTFITSAMEALWKKRKTWRKPDSSLELSEYAHFPRFTHRQIREATGNFKDRIREDASWVEYKGYMLGGSEIVAVKCFRTNIGEGVREEFFNEIIALSKIKHINLVSILGYCSANQEMILVHEYTSLGTLADNIYEVGAPISLTWEQRLRICIGAARGIDCLHSCGIIHRDVKCLNILLDENMVVKIADFGLCRMLGESDSHISTRIVGTYGYLDPAYYVTNMLTKKSDVYSFGIVMLVVLCGKSPLINADLLEENGLKLVQHFRGRDRDEDIVDSNLKGSISSESLKEFVNSLEKCLELKPEKRPSMSQLVVSLENALEKQRYATIMSSASESESDTLEEEQQQQGSQLQPSSSTPLRETAFLSSLSGSF